MRGVCLLLLFAYSISAFAQGEKFKKERRIYLWDVTVSMVGMTSHKEDSRWVDRKDKRTSPKYDYAADGAGVGYIQEWDVFDTTRNTLVQNIRNIKRNDCEIYVFAYRGNSPIVATYYSPESTDECKDKIIQQIEAWDDLQAGKTYTGQALSMALQYATDDRRNTIYVMTDGVANDSEVLYRLLREWPNGRDGRTVNRTLLYVELSENAVDPQIDSTLTNDDNPYTRKVGKDDNMNEQVDFTLTTDKVPLYVNDLFAKSDSGKVKGVIPIGCRVSSNYGEDQILCVFKCEDNPYITFESSPLKSEGGVFNLPYELKMGSASEYYAAKDELSLICLTCEVAESCRDKVFLQGSDKIDVELVVKPEPRVVISLSPIK